MRRLVIELDVPQFARMSGDRSIEKIRSLRVLHFLKEDPERFEMVCSVELRNPAARLEEVFQEEGSEVHVLDHDRTGRFTALFKSKPRQDPNLRKFLGAGGYLSTPMEIGEGKVKATFVGSGREIRELLSMVKRAGMKHRVLQSTDAYVPSSSPLNVLTERQRRALVSAFELGYYDVPRRINTEELAKRLKVRGSTFAMHRIKAERRLIAELLKESRN